MAAVTANYRAGNTGDKLDLMVDAIEAQLTGLRLPLGAAGEGEGGAGLSIGTVALKGGSFDLARQMLAIGSIDLGDTRLELALADGSVFAVRKPEGQIFLLEGLKALAAVGTKKKQAAANAKDEAAAAPWRFRLDQVNVSGLDVFMRDEGFTPALEIGYEKIALNVKGVSENLGAALPGRKAITPRPVRWSTSSSSWPTWR